MEVGGRPRRLWSPRGTRHTREYFSPGSFRPQPASQRASTPAQPAGALAIQTSLTTTPNNNSKNVCLARVHVVRCRRRCASVRVLTRSRLSPRFPPRCPSCPSCPPLRLRSPVPLPPSHAARSTAELSSLACHNRPLVRPPLARVAPAHALITSPMRYHPPPPADRITIPAGTSTPRSRRARSAPRWPRANASLPRSVRSLAREWPMPRGARRRHGGGGRDGGGGGCRDGGGWAWTAGA